ncbi:STAS domain-containing protein [bacterium]|nr:STAS domain-containing protein [bacterium]NUN45153.1 STAS domain-containing protein [bacterium]
MEGIQTTVKFAGPGDSVAVIKVGGYIDTTTSSELERTLGSLLKKNQHRIVVDLGDVDYISSAGWGIFISEIKGIKENSGDLKLVRMIPEVYEVFELLEFHYILKAYDTLDEAVDAFVKESGGSMSAKPKDSTQTMQAASVAKPVTAAPVTKQASKPADEAEDEEDNTPATTQGDETPDEYLARAVRQYPTLSAWQLKKVLMTSDFGFTNMGWFEIRKKMKSVRR